MNTAGYDRKRCNEKRKSKGVEEQLLLHDPSVARVTSAVEDSRSDLPPWQTSV
jgi:hypothetical protein